MSRPMLLGMNNPHGSDPRYALVPHPPGCAGHRLWSMLREAYMAKYVGESFNWRPYMRTFERRNLVASPTWDRRQADLAASALASEVPGRSVVLLGASVWDACRRGWGLAEPAERPEWGEWHEQRLWGNDEHGSEPVRFCVLPHPSGRNRVFNNENTRQMAGRILLELYEEHRG